MRAAIEISDEQTARLQELAARNGEDFSRLIQEAIEQYLDRSIIREERVREALAILGTLDEESAQRLERSVLSLRSTWR
ncbi:MAG: ribbon-helix-helix protein, CopG family [Acidobacteria bacterium]|nr:ribbon-helix-helix protein, CopG family [Acidobacteriota bacterium]